MGTGFLSQGVKRLGCDCDQSPSIRAVGKNEWGYVSTLPITLNGVEKDNFTTPENMLILHALPTTCNSTRKLNKRQ